MRMPFCHIRVRGAESMMAPIGEKSGILGFQDGKREDEAAQNLWGSILTEVQSSSTTKLPSCKVVLVLGDNESGKTTLIAKMQGNEDPKKGSGLEYHYIDVRDEYREDHTRLGVWVLDGDPSHSYLLRFTLSKKTFSHTTVMLCVSMTQPWNVMESLHTWATILQNHIDRLHVPLEDMKTHQQKVVKRWQDYIEPGDELDSAGSPIRRTSSTLNAAAMSEEEAVVLPLGENTLTRNLGLDIVVVITKTDFMSNLEKEYDYKDEHFDFIQQSIRKFCLHFGASLFYTSVKEDKNCDLLSKYLVHRIYGFPFQTPALVVEKDAVFIPSGWDNEKKISILYENMSSMKPDDYYPDIIAKPIIRKPIQREIEVLAEDEQVFLMKQQTLLNQQVPAQGGSPRQESPIRAPVGVQKTPDRRGTGSPGGQVPVGSPKKPMWRQTSVDSPKSAAGTSEGVLANFFNSLLSKKTGAAGSPGVPGSTKTPEKSAVRNDVAAELDRMTRPKKPVPNQTSPTSNSS